MGCINWQDLYSFQLNYLHRATTTRFMGFTNHSRIIVILPVWSLAMHVFCIALFICFRYHKKPLHHGLLQQSKHADSEVDGGTIFLVRSSVQICSSEVVLGRS